MVLAQPFDEFRARRHRFEVGLREVPIVLCGLLAAARRGVTVLVEVPGLLCDRAARLQNRCLAAHLVAHSDFDALERVHVLGLGARAELRRTLELQRQVGVATHRALIHPDVGNSQGTQQIPQCGHIRPGDLRCPVAGVLDGPGDDLDQRNTRPVVVDQRRGRALDAAGVAAEMRELAGVLLHVRAFDLDAPGRAVLEWHVEVAVDGDRLVVLADLVVLRLVRVEVVLPGEPAPRCDVAVERQADPNGRLDRGLVEHRQGSGQTQAHRAHLRVGLAAELVGAPAEHLGGSRELDVDFHTHHGVVARDDVLVVQQFGSGDSHGFRS